MTRFQLVFSHPDGDVSEIRDSTNDGAPHIDGMRLVDGETYTIRGLDWIVRREDHSEAMIRFVCTLAVERVAD